MEDWNSWQEHGGPASNCHYFAARIAGELYHVTPKPWRAHVRRDGAWHKIGADYDGMIAAMRACSRTDGNGDGWHGFTRSRESLCAEANALLRDLRGPECTFAALTNAEIWAMIGDLRIERDHERRV